MASISLTAGTTSVVVSFIGTSDEIPSKYSIFPASNPSTPLSLVSTTQRTYTFTGLSPNTSYVVYCTYDYSEWEWNVVYSESNAPISGTYTWYKNISRNPVTGEVTLSNSATDTIPNLAANGYWYWRGGASGKGYSEYMNHGTNYYEYDVFEGELTDKRTTTSPAYCTTTAAPTVPFVWDYAGLDTNGNPAVGESKVAGYGVYITAAEWNRLVGMVNTKKSTSIGTVTSGTTPISATVVNQVASALNVSGVTQGQQMTAYFFNSLKNAYNNLP